MVYLNGANTTVPDRLGNYGIAERLGPCHHPQPGLQRGYRLVSGAEEFALPTAMARVFPVQVFARDRI